MLFTLVRLRRRLSLDSSIPYTYTQAKTASETQCDLSWDTTEYDFHWFPVPRLGWFGLQQRPWRDGSAFVDGGLGISDEWCGHCLAQRVTMSSILAKVNTHTLKRSEMSNKHKSVLILTALRLVVLGGDRQPDDIESSHAIHQQHPQYLQKGVTVLLIMLLASQYLIYLFSIPKRRPQHGTRHHRWPLFQGSSGGPETRRHGYYGYYGMIWMIQWQTTPIEKGIFMNIPSLDGDLKEWDGPGMTGFIFRMRTSQHHCRHHHHHHHDKVPSSPSFMDRRTHTRHSFNFQMF